MKNIIIYTHMPQFNFNDGGTVVQYYLAQILEEYGQNVRIYPSSNIKCDNLLFSKFYSENDFPIDDNTVVIYCEGTPGNPLNAKNVVRWMLSKLGQNIPYERVHTWSKNEIVYYFNSEEKIVNNPDKVGSIYKLLNMIFVNPNIINYKLISTRKGTCFTIRKALHIHGKQPTCVHPPGSFEITRQHTQKECIIFFNNYKFFISYDPLTFLSVIAALCGCISIVKKVDGLSKEQWLNTTAASEYLNATGEKMLYGIAYGADEISNAMSTIHMAKEQWNRITNFSKEKYVKSFINDINNWNNINNTVQNNFY